VTHRTQGQSQYGSLIVRPELIEEARRHQRRRHKVVGTVLIATLAVGCFICGAVFVDAGGQGKVVAHTATSPSKGHASPAPPQKSPSTLSPTNVVVLNPATGDVVAAEQAAAALEAAQNAAAAQAVNTRRSPSQGVVPGQEASQAANAEAQAAAAAAAATQAGQR
jgi:uncharacterized iron-regulated membrane protein